MSYDLWKTGYYDDLYGPPETECYKCHEKDQTFDEAQNHLEEIVKQLYINQSFDKEHFEFALQELSHLLKVKIPDAQLTVQARPTKVTYIGQWIETNNIYLKSLVK